MNFGTSYKLTSVNNFWFSACRHCVVFFAVAKGDWVMCVGTGSWALSGETFLAWRSGLDLEAEEEGWGLSSSSPSSSSTMILSAIEAGATAIQNAGFLKYKQAEWDQNRMTHKHQNFSVFMICTIFTLAQKKGDKFWPCGHFWLFKYQSRDLHCEQSSTNPGYFYLVSKRTSFRSYSHERSET